MNRLEEFRGGKLYDFLMGVPLILWFGYGVVQLRPDLSADARALLDDPYDLLFELRFWALFAAAAFNLLLIYLVTVRSRPVRRASGLWPRACALGGTFLGVGILHLKVAPLSLAWQAVAAGLVCAGSAGSAIVLAKLGKAFAIMPEARVLVTGGLYAHARHPLYAMETVTLIGIALQFAQPWAALLAIGVVGLQVARSVFEERVLVQAYPEYEEYRARVKRFGVI